MIESVWNFYSLWNSRHAVANHECAMERFWSFLCSWTQLVSALQLQCFILLSSPWRSLLDQTTLHINNSHVFAQIFFQSLILAKLPFHLQLPSRLLQYSRVPCISLWDSQGKKSGVTPLMLLFSHLFFFPFLRPTARAGGGIIGSQRARWITLPTAACLLRSAFEVELKMSSFQHQTLQSRIAAHKGVYWGKIVGRRAEI